MELKKKALSLCYLMRSRLTFCQAAATMILGQSTFGAVVFTVSAAWTGVDAEGPCSRGM